MPNPLRLGIFIFNYICFMKIKAGSFFVDASGKLGGHQIGRNNGTLILGTKSVGNQNASQSQAIARSQTKFLMSSWQSISDAQQLLWLENAKTYTRLDVFADKHLISGFELFNIVNQNRLRLGLSILSTPPAHNVPDYSRPLSVAATETEIIVTNTAYNSNTLIDLYVSPPITKGVSNPRKYLRRLVTVTAAELSSGYDIFSAYTSRYGSISIEQNFYVAQKTISNLSYYSNKILTINKPIVTVGGIPDALLLPSLVSLWNGSSIDPSATIDNDLISSWDDIISSNNGSQSGSARPLLYNGVNVSGRQVRFTGSQSMPVGNPSNLNFIPQTDSFTFVVKFGDIAAVSGLVLAKSEGAVSSRQYFFEKVSGNNFFITIGGSFANCNTAVSINALYIITVSTSLVNVRANGAAVLVNSATVGSNTTSSGVVIGDRAVNSYPFNGSISFIAMYNSVLTPSEIAAIESQYN